MANLSSFLSASYVGYTGSVGGTDISLDSSPTLGGDLNTTGNDLYSANNDLAILGGGTQATRPQVHLTNNGGLALYGGSATNAVNKKTDTYGVKIDGGDGIIDVASDLVLTGDNYNITFDKSTDDLIFDSGARAYFNDQWIYNDGSVFRIGNGAGSTNDTYFSFKSQTIFYRAGTMNSLMTVQNGVQRFHVNGKITTAADIEVGGSILNADDITTGPASGNPTINLGDGSGNFGTPVINFNAASVGVSGFIKHVANGGFEIKSNSAGDYIRLQTYDGSHHTPLEVDGNTVTISSAYDLPTSDGSSGQVLATDGSGALSFADAGGDLITSASFPSASFSLTNSDKGKYYHMTGSNQTITLPASSAISAGWYAFISLDKNAVYSLNISAASGDSWYNGEISTYTIYSGNTVLVIYRGSGEWGLIGNDYYMATSAYGSGSRPTSSGARAVAIGASASASGNYTYAFGKDAAATGLYATAMTRSRAGAASSFAAAIDTNSSSYGTTGANSVAIGKQAKVTSASALAIGQANTTSGLQALTLGYTNQATGSASAAIGYSNNATSTNGYAYAFGLMNTVSSSNGGGAFGATNTVTGNNGYVIGVGNTVSHENSVAIGSGISSSATNQINLGHTDETVRISSTYTLPTSDGTNGQVLTTDGSGAVSFADAGGGGGPNVGTTASNATLTAASTNTSYHITALAADATIAAPSGTPVDGHKLVYRFKDDGTSRTLTWNSIFRAIGTTIPSATSAGKVMYVGTIYNGQDSKWDVISVTVEI